MYPDLATAVGRMGMLIHAVNTDATFLQSGAPEWHRHWHEFTVAWAALAVTSASTAVVDP